MCKVSETDISKVEMLPGNIFLLTIKAPVEIDLASCKRLVRTTNDMVEETPGFDEPLRVGIYDISKIAYIHDDARNYLARAEDIKGRIVASAIISNSFLGRMVGNLFITLGKPTSYPVKFFDSPIRAEHWVRTKMTAALENRAHSEERKVA